MIARCAFIGHRNLYGFLNRLLHVTSDRNFDLFRDGVWDGDGFVSGDLPRDGLHLSDLPGSYLLTRDVYGDRYVDRLSDRAIIDHLSGLILSLLSSHRHLVSVLLIENSLLVDDLLNDSLSWS